MLCISVLFSRRSVAHFGQNNPPPLWHKVRILAADDPLYALYNLRQNGILSIFSVLLKKRYMIEHMKSAATCTDDMHIMIVSHEDSDYV